MTNPVMLLSQVHGEGRITYRALTEAGFNTLAAIASAQTEVLSDKAFLSPATAGRLKAGAREMLSGGGAHAPVAGVTPRPASTSAERAVQTTGRIAGRRSNVTLAFDEGISSVEALMLGQGGPAGAPQLQRHPRDPHAAPAEARVDREGQGRTGKTLRDDPQYAAFLPDASSGASAHAAPVHGMSPGPAKAHAALEPEKPIPRGEAGQKEATRPDLREPIRPDLREPIRAKSFWSFGADARGSS